MLFLYIFYTPLLTLLNFSFPNNSEELYKNVIFNQDSLFIKNYLKIDFEIRTNESEYNEFNESDYTNFKIIKKYVNLDNLSIRQYIIRTTFLNGREILISFIYDGFEFTTIFMSPEGEIELFHDYEIIDDKLKVYKRNYAKEFYNYDEVDKRRFIDDTLTYKIYNPLYID